MRRWNRRCRRAIKTNLVKWFWYAQDHRRRWMLYNGGVLDYLGGNQ